MSATSSPTSALPSIQTIAQGVPRFHVPAAADDPSWPLAVELESNGGVEAEVRTFLDAQLETGDVLLDLNPGFGFVSLSATTAPGGMPTVFIAGLEAERLQQLQDAAADAGGWLDTLADEDLVTLAATIDARLEPTGRVFVHTIAANVSWVCETLRGFIDAGRLLAICVSDAFEAPEWPAASASLVHAGMTPCTMVEQDGDALLLPLHGAPHAPVIALPASVAGVVDDATEAPDIFGSTMATAPIDDPVVSAPLIETVPLMADERWRATRDGLSFIAPYSRTGYGIAGAHLLRALQQKQIPVAFFPIGPLDRSLIDTAQLDQGLRLQGAFRPDVPSVRMSQQFDLALHVGRGRHVAYTTFELDRFTASELHHLRQQDAICVASEWGRQVCLENGLTDTPIHVVPHGVDRALFHENVTPAMQWSETVFLHVGKLESRKGQLELLRAFEAAFAPTDDVRLVLSCRNPFVSRAEFDAQLKPFTTSRMASRITVLLEELPSLNDVAGLMASADCGVFPSRAEGWNLEALEMLSMGKAVIATSYSAHNEYMNADNTRLVKIDAFETAVSNGVALPGQWAAWGNAQHEQLVTHLRAVHARKQAGGVPRNDSGIRAAQRYSWENAADCLVRALDAIV